MSQQPTLELAIVRQRLDDGMHVSTIDMWLRLTGRLPGSGTPSEERSFLRQRMRRLVQVCDSIGKRVTQGAIQPPLGSHDPYDHLVEQIRLGYPWAMVHRSHIPLLSYAAIAEAYYPCLWPAQCHLVSKYGNIRWDKPIWCYSELDVNCLSFHLLLVFSLEQACVRLFLSGAISQQVSVSYVVLPSHPEELPFFHGVAVLEGNTKSAFYFDNLLTLAEKTGIISWLDDKTWSWMCPTLRLHLIGREGRESLTFGRITGNVYRDVPIV